MNTCRHLFIPFFTAQKNSGNSLPVLFLIMPVLPRLPTLPFLTQEKTIIPIVSKLQTYPPIYLQNWRTPRPDIPCYCHYILFCAISHGRRLPYRKEDLKEEGEGGGGGGQEGTGLEGEGASSRLNIPCLPGGSSFCL